jgi:hypothetical protein
MITVATLPQAKYLIELFEPLDSRQLQRLYASGLLTDILSFARKHDPFAVDRSKFQCALGFDPFTFRVRMGDRMNTNQIAARFGCAFDSRITQANFPLKTDEAPWEDTITIVDPNKNFTEEEGLNFLANEGLDRPFYEHPIRFVEQFCNATSSKRKRFVVFLHTSANSTDGHRSVMVFDRHPEVQRLALYRSTSPFSDESVLAGICPRAEVTTSSTI